MTEEEILALDAAGRIRQRLWDLAHENLAVRLPSDSWREITRLAGHIETASLRGWRQAAQARRMDLARAVDFFRDRLGSLGRELEKPPQKIPTWSFLYHELLALYEEFEEVEIDCKEHEIAVTTEPITLEGIFLGPFEIRLDWERLGNSLPYRIKALDPHPAAANEDVTHPHVQNGHLCEGDGQLAIRSALANGRVGDFFLLVAQVLRTYGKGSSYIELDDWEGVSCSDCGGSTYEDERSYCNRCDATLCEDCASTCAGCDNSYCSDCLESCARCNDSFCSSCLTACKNCHEYVCQNCLTNNLCEKCHAQLNTPDDDETAADETNGDFSGESEKSTEIDSVQEQTAVGI
jgi:hypothetical protein